MDPITVSSYNLNCDIGEGDRIRGSSCRSLSEYEDKSFKALSPQIIATLISCANHICVGISLTYSAILIPQLSLPDSDIKATKSQASWLASVMPLTAPLTAILGGFLMEKIGKLNTLKITAIPGLIGWILIAIAWNMPSLILGRVITGISSALATNPATVYVAEISRRDMRGSLLTMGPALVSLGMMIGYLKGWLLHWRVLAWICNVYILVPLVLLYLIPESPVWLISKGRIEEARKSLDWFYKYQPQPSYKNETFAQMQLEQLVKEQQNMKKEETMETSVSYVKEFFKMTVYKPLIIQFGVFFFQQFSGVYIFMFYSVTFFDAVGTSVNPYMASVFIGLIRFVMSLVNTWMLKTFNRRTLMISSALGMSLSTVISAILTFKLKSGALTITIFPIAFLLLYIVSSMIGFLPIPWTMTAEMFPLKIRGLAHSIATSLNNCLMFVAVQNYANLETFLGGSAEVQLFFSATAAIAAIYVFVFLPETHEKKLSEIEEYFKEHWIYIGSRKRKERKLAFVFEENNRNDNHDSKLINQTLS